MPCVCPLRHSEKPHRFLLTIYLVRFIFRTREVIEMRMTDEQIRTMILKSLVVYPDKSDVALSASFGLEVQAFALGFIQGIRELQKLETAARGSPNDK